METIISDPFWSSLFVVAGMILVALEIFIPSAGVLGLCAILFGGLGIYGFWHQGRPVVAVLALAVTLVFIGTVFLYAVRRLRLSSSLEVSAATPIEDDLHDFAGRAGVSITPLRPAGLARIDGKKVDVVATGAFIDKNRPIQVVDTSGNRVVVRELSTDAASASADRAI